MYPEGEQTFGGRCVRQVWSNATRCCGQSTGPGTLACIPIFLAPLALYLTYWSPYRCAICTPYSRSLLFVATATRLTARLRLLATANARTRWARAPLTLTHLLDHPNHNEENSNQRCCLFFVFLCFLIRRWDEQAPITSVVLSRDGKTVFTAAKDCTITKCVHERGKLT